MLSLVLGEEGSTATHSCLLVRNLLAVQVGMAHTALGRMPRGGASYAGVSEGGDGRGFPELES